MFLSCRTITALPPTTNPGIDQWIAPIILAPQTLLTPVTREVIADAASGSVWINRTLRQVIMIRANVITPGYICNAIGIVETSSPVLVGIVGPSPSCGLNVIQEVGNKQQSTSPGLVRQSQKLDAVVDGRLSDDPDLTSISAR